MIIFGTRATVGDAIHTGHTCPACGKENSVWMVPHQRYFHIFWIPTFPTSKGFTPVCNDCGSVFTTEKIPATPEIRSKYKAPKWTFVGLILIVSLIAYTMITGSISSNKNKNEMTDRIESPMNGDVYQTVFTKGEYSLMKVVSYTSDSIYFTPSTHYVNKKSGMSKLMNSTSYETDIVEGYSKEDLKQFAEKNTLFKIVR